MTLDSLKPFIDWMQAHPNWAGFATMLISMAESLAIVGLLIPGTLVMGAIGSLVGSGVLPSLDVILWATTGAIAGDGVSYWLGHHYHDHLRDMWPFRSMPQLMEKGKSFFLKHGRKSVFMGRFIGPIRPVIPVIAGMMNMPPWHFTLANVTSAITWAPVYMLPGYLLGAVSLQLAPQTGTRLLIIAIVFSLGLWASYWIAKHILIRFFCGYNIVLHKLWLAMHNDGASHRFFVLPKIPGQSDNHLPLSLLLLTIVTLGALVFTSYAAMGHIYAGLNNNIWNVAKNLHVPALDSCATGLIFLGELPVLYTLTGAVLCWLIIRREWRTAGYYLLLNLFITASVLLLQINLKVPRPAGVSPGLFAWSYPGYCLALSTLTYGFIGVILARQTQRHGNCYLWITAVLITVIGLSRLYLGVDWFTDVAGGFLLGSAGVLLFALSSLYHKPLTFHGWQLAGIAVLSMLIPWSWDAYHYDPAKWVNYSRYQVPYTLDREVWWHSQPQLFYRHNLRGKPIELLNVQWAGDLSEIKHTLLKKGWYLVSKPNLAIILNRVAAKNREQQLPVFPQLYLHSRPVLIMTRLIPSQKKMMVLRLWQSQVSFTAKDKPLWLGSIAYHQPWKIYFSRKQLMVNGNTGYHYLAAIQQLIHDIPDYAVKEVAVPKTVCLDINSGCSSVILLIKSR